MKHDLENIKKKLSTIERYRKLLLNMNKDYQTPDSFVFEALFAYYAEELRLRFKYEVNVNPDNDTTIDFVYDEDINYKLCFELVSPDLSDPLKIETKLQRTGIDGTMGYKISLTGNHPNKHKRPEAQTIRLQEKLLEKIIKFPEPVDNVFCTIVVDCTNFHFGHFDNEDCRMVMYGRTKINENQESWNNNPILGLLDPELRKKYADDLRSKITAVIFFPTISTGLLENGFLILNCHRSKNHLLDFWKILQNHVLFPNLKQLPRPT